MMQLEISECDVFFVCVTRDEPPMEDVRRLQVTMVGWNQTDEFVITASNDKWLRVWDSCTGELKQILRGHEDNAYVIEAHPQEARLLLTAAHDGQSLLKTFIPFCNGFNSCQV